MRCCSMQRATEMGLSATRSSHEVLESIRKDNKIQSQEHSKPH